MNQLRIAFYSHGSNMAVCCRLQAVMLIGLVLYQKLRES